MAQENFLRHLFVIHSYCLPIRKLLKAKKPPEVSFDIFITLHVTRINEKLTGYGFLRLRRG